MEQFNIEGHGMVNGSRNGGWITFTAADGTTKKVRASKIVKEGSAPAKSSKKAPKGKAKAKGKAKGKSSKRRSVGNEEIGRKIGKSPVRRFAEYEKVKTAEGTVTYDSGDKTARALRGMEIDEVYREAARALKGAKLAEGTLAEIESELRSRYGELNIGMQRMNLGNRIRGAGGVA